MNGRGHLDQVGLAIVAIGDADAYENGMVVLKIRAISWQEVNNVLARG